MRRRPRGFTLLELLLALLISATIAGSLAATLYIAFRARNAAERAVATGRTVDVIGEIITRDLSNALRPTGVLASTFTGTKDSVEFYCTGPESKVAVQGDCKRVAFTLADDSTGGGHPNLVRDVTTNLLSSTELAPTEERLCGNVVSLAFAYYDGSSWSDAWDSTQHDNTLPVAVEMTLVLQPPDGSAAVQTTRLIPLACAVAASSSSSSGGTQ